MTVDVAVVGGGVIGCAVAYYAARRGAKVVLLEGEKVGAGASGQTVGLLAAQGARRDLDPLANLMLRSRGLYESLYQELGESTGLDVELVRAGSLHVTTDAESERDLAEVYHAQEPESSSLEWLDGREARELEPNLTQKTRAALYAPEDAQVNPPRLVQALALAITYQGAEIKEGVRVTGFISNRRTVSGVRTTEGSISAGKVVLAGGVYGALLAGQLSVDLPVFPVKGEILTVSARPTPMKASVLAGGLYLVPKRDGRVIVGSTESSGVYDPRPTLGGVASLSRAAAEVIPGLSSAVFVEAWGGLRPGTPDGYPILGPIEGWENLLVATGHYRNGVLLAPITGQVVCAVALGETPSVDVSHFAHRRFAGS